MIRSETDSTWILVKHTDHAWLAGEFGDAWGNAQFARPEPYEGISYAVYHHDDGWRERDSAPTLTPSGKPEAFTSSLVGAYSAFEEIDLPNYLRVRGAATAAVAEKNAFAGIVTSMHTYNLLSDQADVSTIRAEHRAVHAEFLLQQVAWQKATAKAIGADQPSLLRGFEFLQCCDNLSLIVCSGYPTARELRHQHPDREGRRHTITCSPINATTYSLSPWPLGPQQLVLNLPYREVAKSDSTTVESFRSAYAASPTKTLTITLIPAK